MFLINAILICHLVYLCRFYIYLAQYCLLQFHLYCLVYFKVNYYPIRYVEIWRQFGDVFYLEWKFKLSYSRFLCRILSIGLDQEWYY